MAWCDSLAITSFFLPPCTFTPEQGCSFHIKTWKKLDRKVVVLFSHARKEPARSQLGPLSSHGLDVSPKRDCFHNRTIVCRNCELKCSDSTTDGRGITFKKFTVFRSSLAFWSPFRRPNSTTCDRAVVSALRNSKPNVCREVSCETVRAKALSHAENVTGESVLCAVSLKVRRLELERDS